MFDFEAKARCAVAILREECPKLDAEGLAQLAYMQGLCLGASLPPQKKLWFYRYLTAWATQRAAAR
jgi:hypothetical protein